MVKYVVHPLLLRPSLIHLVHALTSAPAIFLTELAHIPSISTTIPGLVSGLTKLLDPRHKPVKAGREPQLNELLSQLRNWTASPSPHPSKPDAGGQMIGHECKNVPSDNIIKLLQDWSAIRQGRDLGAVLIAIFEARGAAVSWLAEHSVPEELEPQWFDTMFIPIAFSTALDTVNEQLAVNSLQRSGLPGGAQPSTEALAAPKSKKRGPKQPRSSGSASQANGDAANPLSLADSQGDSDSEVSCFGHILRRAPLTASFTSRRRSPPRSSARTQARHPRHLRSPTVSLTACFLSTLVCPADLGSFSTDKFMTVEDLLHAVVKMPMLEEAATLRAIATKLNLKITGRGQILYFNLVS